MSILQRNPGDFLVDAAAEVQKLAEEHSQYEAALQKLSLSEFRSAEDLIEEVRLKKLKLLVRDRMELLLQRQRRSASPQ